MCNHLIELSTFIFGLCIGSFLNVCIYRLPDSKSIMDPPRSFCSNCGSGILFYDNIPVLSYLWLKGRCRHCNARISVRYPMVELLSGVVALCILSKFGLTSQGLVYYAFGASLIVISFIDIDHKIIPDVITLPGIPVFFMMASFIIPEMTYIDSILGLLAGGGSLILVAWTYHLIAKKEGMGGGDIKLLAMIGALIGWQGVLFTIFAASAAGSVTGLVTMLRLHKNMKLAIPFGPFLSLGAVIYIFFGTELINWYFNLLR